MDLLDFARGAALQWSVGILVAGLLLRVLGVLLLGFEKDFSVARADGNSAGARAIFSRFGVHKEFRRCSKFNLIAGYVLHIGLFISVFLFVPHVLFFSDLLGIPEWPGLPNSMVMIAGVMTVAAALAYWFRRMTDPVMRKISSLEDHLSLLITALPVATGILAYANLGLPYTQMLAVHILSVELLLIWIPFSKLVHVILFIPSRFMLGKQFGRRGVRV